MPANEKSSTFSDNRTSEEIDLLNLSAVLWKGRYRVLYITGTLLLISLLYAFLTPKLFRASVKILPTSSTRSPLLDQLSGLAMADFGIGSGFSENHQLVYPDIVTSDFVLDRVLEHRFTMDSLQNQTLFEFWDAEVDSSQQDWKHQLFEEAKKILREEYIEVEYNNDNGLIIINVTLPGNPILAADLANYITSQLEIYLQQFRKYKATDQKRFIENSIIETKQNMEAAEEALKTFSEENKDLRSPDKQLQFERLRTEADVQKAIYLELRRQLELTRIEVVKETETLDILQSAVVPIEKYRPKRLLIIVVSFFIGIFISIIYIFFNRFWYEYRDEFRERYNKL